MEDVLNNVVIDFSTRTVQLYGEDGEYKEISCEFTKEGYEQFLRVVDECQKQLPESMRSFKI
jgi:hypothetical protein